MNAGRTPVFLMANLGSELTRLFAAYEKGNAARVAQSAARAESIMRELTSHGDLRGGTKEIEILQSIVADVSSGKKVFAVSCEQIERYFMPFALKIIAS